MRIVIDTNIWIHFLIRSSLPRIDLLITDPATEILFSKESLDEFLEVSSRPKFARYFSPDDVSELTLTLESRFPLVEVTTIVDVCRDEKDNFLLALAKDGNAEYLITGDEDLLILKKFGNTTIISLTEFEKILR